MKKQFQNFVWGGREFFIDKYGFFGRSFYELFCFIDDELL